jgi:hypothetical protein
MRNRLAGVRDPGRVRSVLEGTSTSIRTTEKILFSSDWRRIGAIGYLWFDIGVLIACFAAIGLAAPIRGARHVCSVVPCQAPRGRAAST